MFARRRLATKYTNRLQFTSTRNNRIYCILHNKPITNHPFSITRISKYNSIQYKLRKFTSNAKNIAPPNYILRFVGCSSTIIIGVLFYTGRIWDIQEYVYNQWSNEETVTSNDNESISSKLGSPLKTFLNRFSSSTSSPKKKEVKKPEMKGFHKNKLPKPPKKSEPKPIEISPIIPSKIEEEFKFEEKIVEQIDEKLLEKLENINKEIKLLEDMKTHEKSSIVIFSEMDNISNASSDLTDEQLSRFESKSKVSNEQKTSNIPETNDDKKPDTNTSIHLLTVEKLNEELENNIRELKHELHSNAITIQTLEHNLEERNDFLSENLKSLEEGRKAYDEINRMFEELTIELQESTAQYMENMENERKVRLEKLVKYDADIRVLERIFNWYEYNMHFFLNLADVHSITSRMESKLNNGLPFTNELQILMSKIPSTFVSYQLLNSLKVGGMEDDGIMVSTHQQLYDRFCVIEKALRETAMIPQSSDNLWGNIFAKVFSFFMIKEQMSRSGSSNHNHISRAGFAMKNGDLQSTLEELNHLSEDILYPAHDWLVHCRQRLLAIYAIKMLRTELVSRSIRVAQESN